MIFFVVKSQLALFDAPVHVAQHVRKDGTVVAPHIRIQKVAVKQHSLFGDHHAEKPEAKPKRSKLDVFIERKGGLRALGAIIASLTEDQQRRLFEEMGKLGGKSPEDVAAMFAGHYDKAPAKNETPDLFADKAPEPAPAAAPEFVTPPKLDMPTVEHDGDTWHILNTGHVRDDGKVLAHLSSTTRGRQAKNGVHPVHAETYIDMPEHMKPTGELVEHTTGKGKVLRGVVRADLTQQQAKEIDPYTFKKDGGWFIREKHLGVAAAEQGPREGERNAEGLIFRNGRWHRDEQDGLAAQPKPGIRQQVRDLAARFKAPPADYKPGDVIDPIDLGKLPYGTVFKITNEKFPDYVRFARLERGDVFFRKVRGDGWQKNPLTPQQRTGVLSGEYGTYTLESLGDRENEDFPRAKQATRTNDPNTTDRGAIVDTGDKLADYWANSAGASIQRDVKAGRVKKVDLTKPAAPVAHDPTAPFGVVAGTTKNKRRDINAGVVARLAEGGPYSDADLAMFRQYSGNGGCGDSLNEFYTDPGVARSMWEAIRALGVEHGTALEPSCATGVFLHTAPEGFRVTGVELDPVSAQVASALHGDRHEIHTASLERFATTDDRQFDVVIGNPPYGPRGFLAKDDKKDISTAEQYFTDTALDKCKPGGVVALVVPTGIMDSKSARGFRERMLTKGEFLGAQRMPNTAFEHSHTEVTTDVIFLRKRPDDVAGALGTLGQADLQKLGVWDDEFLSGAYFTGRGASNVLGTMTEGWRAKAGMGNDITVEGSMDGVADAIAKFEPDSEGAPATAVSMHDILEHLGDDDAAKDRALSAGFRKPYANLAKVGDTKTVDGITYVLQGDPPRWHRVDEFMQTSAISDAQDIAADIDRLFTGQAVNRPELEKRIRDYVEKHGVPADNVDLMTAASVDKKLFRLVGAVNRKGELSDVVLGKGPRKVEGGFDATAQVLALEHDGGEFTAGELAERLDKPLDEVLDQLAADPRYAYAGGGKWTTMDTYLTGELWPKLDAARAALESGAEPEMADKRRLQVERLEKVIDAKSLEDVDFQMNSAFIPTDVLAAFMNWKQYDAPDANEWTKKQEPVEITFADGIYTITGGNSYGDPKLLDKYLNRDFTGTKREDAKPQIDKLNAEFKEWLCASSHRERVEDFYNRNFRGYVAPEFSNSPIDVPGLATDRTVRDWRWSSLRKSLAEGKGIIADDVGLGKTLGGLLLARMAKINGQAKKPIIVVPKSVLANWFQEANVWFPGSRVLTIGANFANGSDGALIGKDDNAAERKRKYHDLTQNDYDFVLISEPAFEEIDLSPEKKEEYHSTDFWVQRGASLEKKSDKKKRAAKENFEQSVAKREFDDRTDAIYFEGLGIDMLIADEMHHQKNLYAARSRFGQQPKFLGGTGQSARSLDFNLKARWVREKNGGKNVYGLTATPTKNSPLEVYSMLSHIAPEAFERIKIRNSEEFLDRFCEFKGDKVLSTSGKIEDALVVSGFKNLDELREIMSRYIDRRTAAQVGLKLPERDDRMHLVDMTPAQQAIYADLRAQLEESAKKKDATGDAHVFSIMDKMNKAALDLELMDKAAHAGAASPKYQALAKQCLEGAKEGGQIVFSEYVDSHDKIVRALVDAGFKREEIGVINAQVAGSAVKRQNIANAFNDGKLKVVVGNCTMAEGLNMQKTTTDIHHMDVPWEPATLQQRNGRGLRQGNMNESLRIHTYLAKGSFDGYRYQSVSAKKDWQDLLWGGGDRVENLAREGNFSADELRIMMAADPEEARKQYEADKASATARYEAGKRADAQAEFVRFTEMTHSYKSVKNKDTVSAQRLRQKIESAKTSLFNNKYWPAKAALDSASDVLIHPQTGAVLTADVGLDFGGEGKMVVTGVNMRAGTVSLRRYADTSGGKKVTVPVSEISDAKPYKFDAAAEADEVGKLLEDAANEKLHNLTKWEEVKRMPSAVLEKNHDLIQRQIKDAKKSYKGFNDLGDAYMVHKETGELERVPSYATNGKHDTHDYLLPTDSAKEKAIQAWIDARREASVSTEMVNRTRGRGSRSGGYDHVPRRQYKGAHYNLKHINPFKTLLDELGGDGARYGVDSALVKEAKARLQAEQMQRIRRAASANDAIEAMMPLAKISGGGYDGAGDREKGTATFPKDALAMAWARARHLGQLDEAVGGRHNSYAYAGAKGASAHAALMQMARASGHRDLADAFAHTAERHGASKSDLETLRTLTQFGETPRGLEVARKIGERLGIMDKTIEELRPLNLSGSFAPRAGWNAYTYGHDGGAAAHNKKKFGDVLNEIAGVTAKKEAA